MDDLVLQDPEATHIDLKASMPLMQGSTPGDMSQAHGLTGPAHRRFVIVTVLLCLIDPVRGEPTAHSLDRHPHDSNEGVNLQKKFLDSFALICSTSRVGGDTASAVCLEQDHLSGNVLRLARNLGVTPDLISQLQQILDDLAAVATEEKTRKEGEDEILLKIINLTHDKMKSLLGKLRDPEVHTTVRQAISAMEADDLSLEDHEETNFRQWITRLPALISLEPDTTTPTQLIPHIKWASKAKWVYAEQIEEFFCSTGEEFPMWIKHIYKLGRYFSATKAMLKLAIKQPGLFESIHVEALQAPEPEKFSLQSDMTALRTTLERLNTDSKSVLQRLGERWLTNDPEARLRQACNLELKVHAEMQLLAFYDHNPKLTPNLLFMGTSKKACFLCHEFISRHPLTIGVSASHQKLYPRWMPAPCSSKVRKRHKTLLWDLNRHLEATTISDLETRLGMVPRPNNLDSTAGPSLTTTGTIVSELPAMEMPIRSQTRDDEDSSSTGAVVAE